MRRILLIVDSIVMAMAVLIVVGGMISKNGTAIGVGLLIGFLSLSAMLRKPKSKVVKEDK